MILKKKSKNSNPYSISNKKLTFVEHLEELRSRIIKSVVFIVATSFILYTLKDKMIAFVTRPVGSLVFIAPTEAFITSIKITLFAGFYASSPFIFYQIWQFISAGLEKKEKGYILIFGLFSFLFFLLGSLFGYFLIVPIGMKFLLGFASSFLYPMISMAKYISFVMMLSLAFGVVFQLPIAILFLTKIGLVTPRFLAEKRKYAIVIIFIAGALFTPPDVITQCLMAIPLVFLYELSIFLSRLVRR